MRMESRVNVRRSLLVIIVAALVLAGAVVAQDGPKLVGAFFVKGKVGLKWMAVDNASEYIVYRKAAGTEFAKLGSTDKTNFFDTQLSAGSVYTYKVAAVVDGNEVEGNTKDVALPATIDAFSAPKGLVVRINDRSTGVALRWVRVKGAIAYNILRSTTSGSGYESVANVSKIKHSDTESLEAGETYYYVITAMNEEFEESGQSDEAMIKFGFSQVEIDSIAASESTLDLDSIHLEFAFEVTEAEGIPLKVPDAIAINSKGDIYITDQKNARVVCTDADGKVKFTFGERAEDEDRYDAPGGAFMNPFAIAIDKNDQVYVSDIVTKEVQIFTAEGKFVKKFTVLDDEGEHTLRANGIDIFDDGRILCTDVGNHRVLILDTDGNILTEYNSSATFACHFPNGIEIIDDNSFVFTNALVGRIITSDFKGNEILRFGSMGTNIGSFGRAVAVTFSEEGLYWVVDNMGSDIQAFNKEGEVKIVIPSNYFSDENLQIVGPRGIIVKDGMLYIMSERSDKLLAFKYQIIESEE